MLKVRGSLPGKVQARYFVDTDKLVINAELVPEDQEHLVLEHLALHLAGMPTPYARQSRPPLRLLPGGRGGEVDSVHEAS